MSFFDEAVQKVLDAEGGYTNDPLDAGGATNWGITIGDLKTWRHDPSLTPQDVKDMKVDEAKAIYKNKYWDSMNLDQVHDKGVACCLFDQGVNRGIGTVAKQVQRVLNTLGYHLIVDGVMGQYTIRDLNATNPRLFLVTFLNSSTQSYVDIVLGNPSQIRFLKGWMNRVAKLWAYLV